MREFREISVKSLAGCYSKKAWSVPCVLMAAGVIPDELRPPCRMLKHWLCHRSETELINVHVFTKVVSACVLNNNSNKKKMCSFLLSSAWLLTSKRLKAFFFFFFLISLRIRGSAVRSSTQVIIRFPGFIFRGLVSSSSHCCPRSPCLEKKKKHL